MERLRKCPGASIVQQLIAMPERQVHVAVVDGYPEADPIRHYRWRRHPHLGGPAQSNAEQYRLSEALLFGNWRMTFEFENGDA